MPAGIGEPLLGHDGGDGGRPELYRPLPHEVGAEAGDIEVDGPHQQLEG